MISKKSPPSIGGFFPLEIPSLPLEGESLWDLWTQRATRVTAYHNGRSALFHLLKDQGKRIWLPSYICPEVPDACYQAGLQVLYYPVNASLVPEMSSLGDHLQPHDFVLAVCYFGRPLPPYCNELAQAHPHVTWIEDRAQALCPHGDRPVFDHVLYSPRKLLGAPDGGLLVSYSSKKAAPAPTHPLVDFSFVLPRLERFEDPLEELQPSWYASYQETERNLKVGSSPLSHLSEHILKHTPCAPLIERRRRNFNFLWEHLQEFCLWSDNTGDEAPFAMPLIIENMGPVLEILYREKVYAARYWRDLPSPMPEFPQSQYLAEHLLALPCDHRYTLEDMKRVVKVFLKAIQKP